MTQQFKKILITFFNKKTGKKKGKPSFPLSYKYNAKIIRPEQLLCSSELQQHRP